MIKGDSLDDCTHVAPKGEFKSMKQEEFDLSKLVKYRNGHVYRELDIKEFVRIVLEDCKLYKKTEDIIITIKKRAGERFR